MSAQRVTVCTRCLRAWDPSRYMTCDTCRSQNRKRSSSTRTNSKITNTNRSNPVPIIPSVTLTNSEPPSKRLRRHNPSLENDTVPETVLRAVNLLLEDAFQSREAARQSFPVEISTSQIRESVNKLQDEIPTPVCSGCFRPWNSSEYRTCDACRSRSRKRHLSTLEKSNIINSKPRNTVPIPPYEDHMREPLR